MTDARLEKTYALAKEQYAALGVDTEKALRRLQEIPISIHCWQSDDVGGFERPNAKLGGGGIQATGDYPGKPRTLDEMRQDLDAALGEIPGTHRLNLHAIYLDHGGTPVDRDAIEPRHFQSWIDWAKERGMGLDFNPTYFSHPKAADGFTLSHVDKGVREFWIEHGKACRRIAAEMGRQLETTSVNNVWIPDGHKDIPADRKGPRERLEASLDAMFAEEFDAGHLRDAMESKLFGIGSESYVVGSHEFYLGYTVSRGKVLCLDAGHYHPTETIVDKISSTMQFVGELLLHVSRPVRWDSDHVVILNDELTMIAQEIVRGDYLDRVHIGLDFFDASINRVAAYVIGTRCMQKALLAALLEPHAELKEYEQTGDYTRRLALMEELKTLPLGAVWDYYCMQHAASPGSGWIDAVMGYEKKVLAHRG